MKILKLLPLLIVLIITGCSNLDQSEESKAVAQDNFYPFQIKGDKVYYEDREIAGAEADSFELYKSIKCNTETGAPYCFSRDQDSVFYYSTEIKDANPNEFIFLEDGYKKDSDSVFYIMDNNRDWYIEEADAESFYVLGHSKHFVKSENCTVFQNQIHHKDYCKNESSYAYAKDNKHAYYDGRVIPNADGPSFVLIIGKEEYDAMDKNHKYKDGELIE